jgi:hypothetical protein
MSKIKNRTENNCASRFFSDINRIPKNRLNKNNAGITTSSNNQTGISKEPNKIAS